MTNWTVSKREVAVMIVEVLMAAHEERGDRSHVAK